MCWFVYNKHYKKRLYRIENSAFDDAFRTRNHFPCERPGPVEVL